MTKKNNEETITEEKSTNEDESTTTPMLPPNMSPPPPSIPEAPVSPITIILTYHPDEGRLSINSSGEVNVGLFLEMLHGAEKRIMTLPIGNTA